MEVSYTIPAACDLTEIIALYERSTLGLRRPIGRPEIMQRMLDEADVLVLAREGDRLVGLARTLTDFAYVAYLADLAVDIDYQRRGIGRRLIEETEKMLESTCMLTLLAAPAAQNYYAKVGFEPHPRAWWRPARETPVLKKGS